MGHRWKKGQSGNPDGAAMTASLRKQALDYALDENGDPIIETGQDGKPNKIKNLDLVARQLIRKAKKGDISAIQECFNRLDGKVANINHNTNDLGEGTIAALLEAIDGKSRDHVAPKANGHDSEETVH